MGLKVKPLGAAWKSAPGKKGGGSAGVRQPPTPRKCRVTLCGRIDVADFKSAEKVQVLFRAREEFS